MFGTRKVAAAVVAAVLGLAVTGAAALAAVPPVAAPASASAADVTGAASMQAERDGTGLVAILDRLVANGTITRAQADAILAALKQAAQEKKRGDREGADVVKRVLANMLRLAVEYIGLPHQAVAGQLKAGKSLGEIAASQPGKSREGLIAYLVEKVTAQLDKAVADGKITQERADQVKAGLTAKVTRFVDHTYERKPASAERKKQST